MGFLNELKKNANLRKIFGVKELQIIEKQLLGMDLKNSEKTRLSRDIRKKFEAINFFKDYSQYFELKKGILIKELIQETIEEIKKSNYIKSVVRIFVYGSFLENKSHFNSDVDIAVEFKKINKREAMKFRVEISSRINEKVDLQVYNFLPEKIKTEIKTKGKILYKNEI